MSLNIRPATSADFEAVTALLAELGRPAPTPASLEPLRQVYEAYMARTDAAPHVAEADGEVVGFVSLEFRSRLNWKTVEAWIPDLIVTERARSTGAGKALLQQAFAIARERGCHRLSLESGHARQIAHQFYRLQGMKEAGLYFTIHFSAP